MQVQTFESNFFSKSQEVTASLEILISLCHVLGWIVNTIDHNCGLKKGKSANTSSIQQPGGTLELI